MPQKGLIRWDDGEWKKLQPIAQLSKAQVKYAQAAACRNNGTKVQPLNYIVEIVMTRESFQQKPIMSSFQETFRRFLHPWIRIITSEGKLYSVGFNMGQDLSKTQPTAAIKGSFRSPVLVR